MSERVKTKGFQVAGDSSLSLIMTKESVILNTRPMGEGT